MSPQEDDMPGAEGKHMSDMEKIRRRQKRWQDGTLRESLSRKAEKKPEYRNGSGDFVIQRVYTPLDTADTDYVRDTGFPGEYPFTRDLEPCGQRARQWAVNFVCGFGSPENANQRCKELIAGGADDIWVLKDLPSHLGYDSDDPAARGEVGKVGVAIDTLADLETILDGIPIDKIALGTVANPNGPWAVALFYALCQKRGVDPRRVRVWLQNDPFKTYTGHGDYIFPVRTAVDLASDAVEFCCKNVPGWDPQYTCTTNLRWGGCTAAQEIGFGIANLLDYIAAAGQKGVTPPELVPKLSIHMTADNDLFEEVAKFRAARRLWARVAREKFQTADPGVLALRITVFTGGHRLTAQQPLNNITRTAMHVLAAMLGGVEHIHVPALDEALALPTLGSTRVANLTKHILHDECLVDSTVDPLGGSYYLEALTRQLEEKGRQWLDKVVDMGGAAAAIEQGLYQREMADGMYQYQAQVENGERVIIGVNRFALEEEVPIKIFSGDPAAEARQIERLHRVRRERDNAAVVKSLAGLKAVAEAKAAGRGGNIVPPMLDAVRAYATEGEIFGVLRAVFGEYKPVIII